MIDVSTWGWPQYTLLVLFLISWAIAAVKHGEVMTNPHYNWFVSTVRLVMWGFILTFGGFFN